MPSFNGTPCWQSGDFMIMSKNAQHLSLHILSILSTGCHLTLEAPKYIQGVTGETDQTSGECSLGQTIPI